MAGPSGFILMTKEPWSVGILKETSAAETATSARGRDMPSGVEMVPTHLPASSLSSTSTFISRPESVMAVIAGETEFEGENHGVPREFEGEFFALELDALHGDGLLADFDDTLEGGAVLFDGHFGLVDLAFGVGGGDGPSSEDAVREGGDGEEDREAKLWESHRGTLSYFTHFTHWQMTL